MTTGNSRLFLLVSLSILGSALSADVLEGNYNVTAFCTAVPVGTLLGSIVSCDYYYACTSAGPVNTSCSAGYAFDLNNQQCNPVNQVKCYYGVENVCASVETKGWVPMTGTCNSWIYCENSTYVGNGTCGANQRFDKATSQCQWGKCSSTLVTDSDEPSLTGICEVVPPGFYFGDTVDCTTWNYCTTNNTHETGKCTSSAFIVQSKSCGYNTDNVCSRVTNNELSTVSGDCSVSGETKGDSSVCGTYQQCNGQYWTTNYCASGYYYDTKTQGCVLRQNAIPTYGCDRCQYATTTWTNAVDNSTCSHYWYCNKGVGEAVVCPVNTYFNEDKQGCVSDSSLSSYVANHPVCTGAGTNSTTTAAPDNSTTLDDSSTTVNTNSTTVNDSSTVASSSTDAASSTEATTESTVAK